MSLGEVRTVKKRTPDATAGAITGRSLFPGRDQQRRVERVRVSPARQARTSAEAVRSRTCRHDPSAALLLSLKTLGVSLGVWIMTPVVASFASLVLPHLMTAIFVAGDNDGRSTGNTPYTLYGYLALILSLLNLFVLSTNLLFGMRWSLRGAPWMGTAFGVACFVALLAQQPGGFWLWTIAPTCGFVGLLVAQVFTTITQRTAISCAPGTWSE